MGKEPHYDIKCDSENIEAHSASSMSGAERNPTDASRMQDSGYLIVPNPVAEAVDLSELRGVGSGEKIADRDEDTGTDTDLENLAELVPDVKSRRRSPGETGETHVSRNFHSSGHPGDELNINVESDGAEVQVQKPDSNSKQIRKLSMMSGDSTAGGRRYSEITPPLVAHETSNMIGPNQSLLAQESRDMEETTYPVFGHGDLSKGMKPADEDDNTGHVHDDTSFDDDYPGSDHALEDTQEEAKVPKEFMNIGSSAQSISTATQTHEVRMPMYLPTFKPATGCTNASDFIVRCFVARLRSGITVVKHGRSRWCKSRLRVLHIHSDGRSLSWKPAEGEPTSSKRPPKLDLSTCLEVRHAWSPDPQNPMYTGTPILRQKCEAANAHKSFALIFKQRTVDITAVTADQCKVLMEGFSALCFRLQVANLAGRGAKKGHARPMPEEDGVSTTASATLTNSSTPRAR